MARDLSDLPSWDQLPVKEGAPKGSSWGLFGDDDQLGCINLLTPERVLEAARLVRKGSVFPLNLRIDEPNPPLFGRRAPEHHLMGLGGGVGMDDYLDSFFPQASSQWDGLRHIRHPKDGFYNGVNDEDVSQEEGSKLGMENFARRGIVGRGVLLDLERYFREQGTPLEARSSTMIRRDSLDACAQAQGVQVKPGDVLLLRTGWLRWYLEEATMEQRREMAGEVAGGALLSPGIGPADEMAEYLWNRHVAAVVADNPAVEPIPPAPGAGFMHFRLIPHLGMLMGELWYLEELAADCAQDGVYEFLFTSAPLNVPGGVGSPSNALAVK